MLVLLSSPVCFPGVTNSDRKACTVLCTRPARSLVMPSTVKGTPWQVRPLQVRLALPFYFLVFSVLLLQMVRLLFPFSCSNEHSYPLSFELILQFSSVPQLCQLFATPWTAARQASLSITNSQSLPKLTSIEMLIPSNHLILCHPLLLLPSSFPNIRVFSNELALHIKWPKYRRFSL